MSSKNKKNEYKKADSLLSILFILFLVLSFVVKTIWGSVPLFLVVFSFILCAVAGYVALLHAKLPQSEKQKVNRLTFNALDVHPYATFVLMLIVTIIFLRQLWVQYQ